MRLVTVTADQVGQFLAADAREHGRICDLETVEMQDRKNRAITCGIEKLIGVPARGQCAGFRLAIANHTGDDQIRIIERSAIGVNQRIAEFSAFVYRAGSFRRYVTGNSVRPGELAKEPPQSISVALD